MEEISISREYNSHILFDKHIKSKGISYSYIARSTQYSPSYIHKICKGVFPLTEKMRQKLNELLDTDY